MSWFFKVKSGWSPYSAAQSAVLEAAWNQVPRGEAVSLDDWKVDFEKMFLGSKDEFSDESF